MVIWAPPIRKFDAFIIPDTGIQNNRFSHLNTKISNSNLSVSKAFRSPFPAAADQNRHRDLPAIRANLCACFTCSGRSVSIVWEQDGSLLHGQAGRPEGQSPFGSGFPIGASSIPVGTRFSVGKSSVLYLLRPLTLERGCLTPDRPFQVAAEQTDFVG